MIAASFLTSCAGHSTDDGSHAGPPAQEDTHEEETAPAEDDVFPSDEDLSPIDGEGGDISPPGEDISPAEAVLSRMSLEEKIGQLFIIRPEQADRSFSPEDAHHADEGLLYVSESLKETVADYPPGGYSLFAKNIGRPSQLKEFIQQLKDTCEVLPFIATDEEGGNVARLANSTAKGFDLETYGTAAGIGSTGDPSTAERAGRGIGSYLKEYGINVDFAPVADVNTNPDNIVIGNRAFGSDPQLVADMVCAFTNGLHFSGVLSCTKHFPGHGDTTADSHTGAVYVYKDWAELKNIELIPFEASLDKTDMVMIAHINLPNVTSDGLPASLSGELVSGKLRGELGFDGLIITDSLAMEAINTYYGSAEAAVMAVEAGADIILMPYDYIAAFEGVLDAVRSGRISEDRIDQSVLRILKAKEKITD